MATGLTQYLRQWSIMINGEPFIDSREEHQFRCVFDIVVNPANTFARADIQIYNLSKDTSIENRSDIILSAGYVDAYDAIFIGSITNVFRERRGPDIITRLLCSNGRAQDRGTISSPYGPGAKLTDVLVDVARAWPRYLEIDLSQFTDADVFPTGYTADGDVRDVLDSLASQFDFRWVEDRGSLVVTRENEQRTTTIFEVNQHTGMVGMPEVTRGPQGIGVDVTTRINPYIRTTSRINVQSEFSTYNTGNAYIAEMAGDASATGEYNVFSIHYVGDTHGHAWDMRLDAIRAGTREIAQNSLDGGLVWGARVSQEFRVKVREIGGRQNLDPNWYMAVMAFETGRTFSPAEINRAGSGATGLLQFMPSTARAMGTSTRALANMSAVEQLDYVEKYFEPYVGRINNLGDMYMAVLWPAGIGKADSWVMWTSGSIEYTQNAGLDTNHDGTITRGEAVSRVNAMYTEGMGHRA